MVESAALRTPNDSSSARTGQAELDKDYFHKLANMLRLGGHKLKSKLRPENIGLLLPGDFLPRVSEDQYPGVDFTGKGRNRILKPHVALQIAEKSNHLYSWRELEAAPVGNDLANGNEAFDGNCPADINNKNNIHVKRPGRKRGRSRSRAGSTCRNASPDNNLRNVRPKNRANFVNQEVFYSALDVNFYQQKCEEVLQNEFYNQLENSLQKKQLSQKKIKINEKKKANDTKEQFYYDALLHRPYDIIAARGYIDSLRRHIVQTFRENQRKLAEMPKLQLFRKTTSYSQASPFSRNVLPSLTNATTYYVNNISQAGSNNQAQSTSNIVTSTNNVSTHATPGNIPDGNEISDEQSDQDGDGSNNPQNKLEGRIGGCQPQKHLPGQVIKTEAKRPAILPKLEGQSAGVDSFKASRPSVFMGNSLMKQEDSVSAGERLARTTGKFYFNPVLGLIQKPATVMKHSEELSKVVLTKSLGPDSILAQYFEADPEQYISQRRFSVGGLVVGTQKDVRSRVRIQLPVGKEKQFDLEIEQLKYEQRRSNINGIHRTMSFAYDDNEPVDQAVTNVLTEIVVQILDEHRQTRNRNESLESQSSEEYTDDDFFIGLHEKYLKTYVASIKSAVENPEDRLKAGGLKKKRTSKTFKKHSLSRS